MVRISRAVILYLVNREPLPHMPEFESELLGNCDEIVEYISSKLGLLYTNIISYMYNIIYNMIHIIYNIIQYIVLQPFL